MLCSAAFTQTIDDFEYLGEYYSDELYLGIAFSNSHVTNSDAPRPEVHNIAGLSGELNMRYIRLEAGEMSWRWQHKLLGDMTLFTYKVFTENSNLVNRGESTAFSCGLLGWWNWTWNITLPNRYILSAGFNLNDYFFGSSYIVDSLANPNELKSLEPQGYYFTAGPTIVGQFMINKNFVVEGSASYSISYWRAVSLTYAQEDNSYPKPHWGQLNAEFISRWGVYAALNYNWVINRGDLPNNAKRLDLLLGFRFRI